MDTREMQRGRGLAAKGEWQSGELACVHGAVVLN